MNAGKQFGLKEGPATRDAFDKVLKEIGRHNTNLVVVDGDVSNSTRTEDFAKEFPERFFNVGIAESNLVGVASGLAMAGKDVLAASFAAFLLCNAYDQIRMSVAFPQANVKLVGSHSGISIGEDGPSQMAIEDIALATSPPISQCLCQLMRPPRGPQHARCWSRKVHFICAPDVQKSP